MWPILNRARAISLLRSVRKEVQLHNCTYIFLIGHFFHRTFVHFLDCTLAHFFDCIIVYIFLISRFPDCTFSWLRVFLIGDFLDCIFVHFPDRTFSHLVKVCIFPSPWLKLLQNHTRQKITVRNFQVEIRFSILVFFSIKSNPRKHHLLQSSHTHLYSAVIPRTNL